MRIAIIAPPWVPIPPPAYGGTELVLDGLARGLVAAGHEVVLFATGDSHSPVPTRWVFDRAVGVECMSPVAELRQVINGYAATRDCDIVHDHTVAGPMYARSIGRSGVVTTNHGPFDSELYDLYRDIGCDVPIIAISRSQASLAGEVRVATVIHHGIDVDAVPFGRGDGGYAVAIGRMHASKGIDAAARIARSIGMPLRIAAKQREPAEREYFEHCVKPLLGHGVEYVGEVGGVDKLHLLGDATCLLNPIAWPEPFGMVMIEALAAGTPVVATPCGAVPEIVDDGVTGYIRRSEVDLAEAVLKVEDLSRDACRAAAAARFSIQRMAADHVRFYESITHR
jgi:glycosyltransferase involved in cell wall biosynthesis